jgi:hypothetical protein
MLLRRVAFPDICEPCLPSPADKPPVGAGWLHEIKHDGFRMLVRRSAGGVRRTYDHHSYMEEKKAAMEALASLLASSSTTNAAKTHQWRIEV